MGLELAGVSRIDTPAEARSHARRWLQMARELDTPGAPEQAREKAAELRQRAKAAQEWARGEEDALLRGQQEHDRHLELVPEPEQQTRRQARHGRVRRASSSGARRAGNRAYHAAKPPALRLGVRGRQHFFQGLQQPFGPAGIGWDAVFEGLGLSLAVVLLYDLLSSPQALTETGSHTLGFLNRAIALRDPITGLSATASPPPRTAPARRPAASPSSIQS
jgi:hypothetical protein